jgi:hypothetical protein
MIYKVETKTDALRIFRNKAEVLWYLKENGLDKMNAEWYNQDSETVIVTIPKFKAIREKYIKAKIADCERYGCE